MNKTLFNRLVAICLTISMLIISQTTAFAYSPEKFFNDPIEVITSVQSETDWFELSKLEGAYMYFHDTPKYTFTVNIYQGGKIEINNYDKILNIFQEKSTTTQMLNKTFSNIENSKKDLSYFKAIEIASRTGALLLETQNNPTIIHNSVTIAADTEAQIAAKIDTELTSIFGAPYSGKFRGSKYESGYTAYLYESMHFERYKSYSWPLNAGATLGAVASLMALPQSTVLLILTFVGTASTGYSLYADFTSNKYVANVHNNKEVKVMSVYPYRAGRSEYGYCYVGDKRAAYVSRNKVTKDYDFDDNSSLMSTGIYNYINFGY